MERIPFSGNPLDRAANLRRDAAWLEAQARHDERRYLPFSGLKVLSLGSEPAELCWLDAGACERIAERAEPLLLGLRDGIPHFAVDVSAMTAEATSFGIAGTDFADARGLATTVPEGEAGILAQARALIEWHARHRFCGSCGAPTTIGCGGGVRVCTSCGAEHFPGPHAVVIMVVWRGDRCLLGRGRGWGQTRYSALAGFMDLGETIEEAVAREVMEEVGLEVDRVVYHASQPWPFPMSVMIGCFAHVTGEVVTVDPEELAEARWFSGDEIRSALASPESVDFGVPTQVAIAHHLIRAWSERTWE